MIAGEVIVKKCYNSYTRRYELIAFIPNAPANPGNILSYQHIGQHGEASIKFFNECEEVTKKQAEPLISELKSIGYQTE